MYQNYRRRSRPVIFTTEVTTGRDLRGRVELAPDVIADVKRSQMLPELYDRAWSEHVARVEEQARNMASRGGPLCESLRHAVSRLSAAKDVSEPEVAEALYEVLERQFFDDVVSQFVLNGLRFEPPNAADAKLKVSRIPTNDGSFHLKIPGHKYFYFMTNLDASPLVEEQMAPLVASVEALNARSLAEAFRAILDRLEREVPIARSVEQTLGKKLDESTLWHVWLNLVNYGESAMLMLPRATLEVRKRDAKEVLRAEAFLSVPTDDDQRRDLRPEHQGVLIAAGGTRVLAFSTLQRQVEMTDGGSKIGETMRGRWEDQNSECRVTFEYVSASLRSRKEGQTRWHRFGKEADKNVSDGFP